MKEAQLIFCSYVVEEMEFKLNKSIEIIENKEFETNPKIFKKISEIEKNKFCVTLGLQIDDNKFPFNIKVVVNGYFKVDTDNEKEAKQFAELNGITILFPYLRNIVSSVTLNANVAPYIIPPVNVIALFEKEETEKENNK